MTDEVRSILKKFGRLEAEVGSQNEACRLIGISSGTITEIRNDRYKGNIDNICEKIVAYLKIKEQYNNCYCEIEYADTSISENIYKMLEYCQIKGGLCSVAGDAGIGKTKACRKYVKDHPTNTVLITVNPCITSIKSILSVLAGSVGAVQAKSRDELWLNIRNKLRDGMLLVFDEAQHLTARTIDTLRSFSDSFADNNCTLGIAFIGNLEVATKFGSNCRKAEFAQIVSRTKQSPIYATTQIKRDDIYKLFPILKKDNMEKETDLLLNIAQTKQGIRGTVNLFSNAYDNEDISYKGLIAMAKTMNLNI